MENRRIRAGASTVRSTRRTRRPSLFAVDHCRLDCQANGRPESRALHLSRKRAAPSYRARRRSRQKHNIVHQRLRAALTV
eukprot:1298892-Pyramimonas_sp.AAC.1